MSHTSMLLAIALLLPLAGCVQVQERLEIGADGTGELALDYRLHEGWADTNPQLNLDEEGARAGFAHLTGEGLELRELTIRHESPWRRIHFLVGIKALAALPRWEVFHDRHFALTDGGDGRAMLQFTYGRNPGGSGSETPEQQALMQTMLKGFEVVTEIRLPGAVVESNGERVDSHTVRWRYALEESPDALRRMYRDEPHYVVFDAQGLELPYFGAALPLPAPSDGKGDGKGATDGLTPAAGARSLAPPPPPPSPGAVGVRSAAVP